MTIIQAYKRTKPYTHTFPDITLLFKPNPAGDVVCDVEKESAVQRLLAVPTGFRVYEPNEATIELLKAAALREAEAMAEREAAGSGSERFILVSGTQTLDLRPLKDAHLRAFAKANGIKVPPAATGDAIRELIVEGMIAKAKAASAPPPPPPAGE